MPVTGFSHYNRLSTEIAPPDQQEPNPIGGKLLVALEVEYFTFYEEWG
ncbi:MAG: hypothetical protein MUF72_16575 [Elainella sp. Prado103]|nr:hypothetical protein [Elainella sp. Prado103]